MYTNTTLEAVEIHV